MYDPEDLSDATDPWWDQFPARLDGYALGPDKKPLLVGGQHVYRGVEQDQNPSTGVLLDAPDGRFLDGTSALLFERNNLPIDPYGGVVLARFRGMVGGKLAYDFDATPADVDEIILSGSGACDFTIGGSGEVCIDENVTIVNNATTIINNLLLLGNWFNLGFVTNVCPVFTSTLKIDGVSHTVVPPLMTGLVVERRVARVPLGTVLSDPYCEADPDSCCESGSGSGSGSGHGPDDSCCSPMPPPVLWATIADFHFGGPCECLEKCVELLYDPARDGWYSTTPIGLACAGTAPTSFFRLRCRAGVWFWAIITAGEAVLIEGVILHVICDPFFIAASFQDTPTDYLCGQKFSYVITEASCAGSGSGSGGGGGTVDTTCCPDDLLPATLTAMFGGSLAGLGTVTLTYVGVGASWTGHASGSCGEVDVSLICDSTTNKWEMALLGDTQGGWNRVVADSCSPFRLRADFVAVTGRCGTGAATVEVVG